MKIAVKTGLIVLAVIAIVLALGLLGVKHFLLDDIRDGGDMTNPFITQVENRPAEGANLVYCSLTRSGTVAEENYSYTLEQVDDAVLLYADYMAEDHERVELDGQPVDAETLRALNAMVLAFDLTETQAREDISEPYLFDGGRKTYTLRWDDGTTSKPDAGFDEVDDFFCALILRVAGSTSYSDGEPVMEIQLTVPATPVVGAAPATDISASAGIAVQDAQWWCDDNGDGAPDAPSDDVFAADGNYTLRIVLCPAEGYYVPYIATGDATTPLVYQGNLTVNGEDVSIVPVDEDGTLHVDWWGKPAASGG